MRQEKQGLSCSAGTNKAGCSEQSKSCPVREVIVEVAELDKRRGARSVARSLKQ